MNTNIANTSKRDQTIARAAAEYAYRNTRYTYKDIFAAYERPSSAKVRAWNYCRELCDEMNGFDLIISSRNTFHFSACFKFIDKGTGELCYGYITADYNRYCFASPEVKTAKAT